MGEAGFIRGCSGHGLWPQWPQAAGARRESWRSPDSREACAGSCLACHSGLQCGRQTESLSWLEFSNRLTSQDLQCFTVTWVADIPDPSSFLYPLGHRQGAANFASYSNAAVDSLLSLAQTTRPVQERMQIFREAERQVLRDAAIVPLFHPLSALALQQEVNGVTLTPMGIGSIDLRNVWFEPARLAQDDH